MQKLLLKLFGLMGITPDSRFGLDAADRNMWIVTVPLGTIEETDAWLTFTVGGEFDYYGDHSFIFYNAWVNSNAAEDTITARIRDLYGIDAYGTQSDYQYESRQLGEAYTSLDLWIDGMEDWDTVSDEEMASDENLLGDYYREAPKVA